MGTCRIFGDTWPYTGRRKAATDRLPTYWMKSTSDMLSEIPHLKHNGPIALPRLGLETGRDLPSLMYWRCAHTTKRTEKVAIETASSMSHEKGSHDAQQCARADKKGNRHMSLTAGYNRMEKRSSPD